MSDKEIQRITKTYFLKIPLLEILKKNNFLYRYYLPNFNQDQINNLSILKTPSEIKY